MTIRRDGYWCRVAAHPAGRLWVYVDRAQPMLRTITAEMNPQPVRVMAWQETAPSAPRMLDVACAPDGRICLVAQAQAQAYGLLIGVKPLGGPVRWSWGHPCHTRPAVGWNGEAFVVIAQDSPGTYRRIRIGSSAGPSADGFETVTVPVWPGGDGTTSAGVQHLEAGLAIDGSEDRVQWAGETRTRTIRGLSLTVTTEIAGVVIGQHGEVGAGIALSGGDPFLLFDEDIGPEDPQLAHDAAGWFACSWTRKNAVVYDEFPPYRPLPAPVRPELPTLRALRYPCYAGFSWVPSDKSAPGNCQFLTPMAGEGDGQDWRQMADPSRPVFAGGEDIAISQPPTLLGRIGGIEGAGPHFDYAASPIFRGYLKDCEETGIRPTWYDDGWNISADYPTSILTLMPSWGIPIAECYPAPGEGPEEAMGRLNDKVATLREHWEGAYGVILPCYTQQDHWRKETVLAIATRLYDWSDESRGRLMVAWAFPFERSGPGGPIEDPDMRALGERIVASAVAKGAPELPAKDDADTPAPEDPPDDPPSDEPEPAPDPAPLPPDSSDPFPSAHEVTDMDPEIVGVLGPGGMFGRVDPSEPDRIYFDRSSVGAHERVEVTKPDDKFTLRFVDANVIVNFADRWGSGEIDGESVDLDRQFETRPPDQRGSHERPDVVRMPDGRIVAYVAHTRDGRQFTSAPLTLVRQ
jgi:hypothetical protein